MKKLMTLLLGMSLALGSVAMFAQAPKTKATKASTKAPKTKAPAKVKAPAKTKAPAKAKATKK